MTNFLLQSGPRAPVSWGLEGHGSQSIAKPPTLMHLIGSERVEKAILAASRYRLVAPKTEQVFIFLQKSVPGRGITCTRRVATR